MRIPSLAACILVALAASPATADPAPPPPADIAATAPVAITRPVWTRVPSGDDYASLYPSAAVERSMSEARTTMSCQVAADGRLDPCMLTQEDPPGYGFGVAALRLAKRFRMGPTDRDGHATAGRTITIPIHFHGPN